MGGDLSDRETPQDIGRLILLLARPAERASASDRLRQYAAARLRDLAQTIDDSTGKMVHIANDITEEANHTLAAALFADGTDPANSLEYYSRAARASRAWLRARLTALIKAQPDPALEQKLFAWRDVHTVADALPRQTRAALDVMFYGGQSRAEAALLLGLKASAFNSLYDESIATDFAPLVRHASDDL